MKRREDIFRERVQSHFPNREYDENGFPVDLTDAEYSEWTKSKKYTAWVNTGMKPLLPVHMAKELENAATLPTTPRSKEDRLASLRRSVSKGFPPSKFSAEDKELWFSSEHQRKEQEYWKGVHVKNRKTIKDVNRLYPMGCMTDKPKPYGEFHARSAWERDNLGNICNESIAPYLDMFPKNFIPYEKYAPSAKEVTEEMIADSLDVLKLRLIAFFPDREYDDNGYPIGITAGEEMAWKKSNECHTWIAFVCCQSTMPQPIYPTWKIKPRKPAPPQPTTIIPPTKEKTVLPDFSNIDPFKYFAE